ncbi:PspC domain-containing protein [Leifsonia naganoensis]|uniref:Phage shock protein PspC (Stress-responsive transcriptional regulator) n=1 Tax=Leifsonia naganoensis TaxID=150025 RepID=A0A853DL98_9MICO|nr:PspC domain-containing protein [Leifsonia naganoensis]NYK09027.1 phage shock protein PspC (stress-responsive transcriptional regulator) [Leifsonia naganoensis]
MSQNDSTTTPPPYGGPSTGLSGRGSRFFDWMRSLGVVRADGWVGGVCAGVAYRLGIDPLIVRGIAVVAALLGAPVLLVYALAWALLPDRDGRIHLQRLFEGDVDAPIVAAGVLIVLSLLPWSSGLGWFGGGVWHDWGWAEIVGRVFWTLLVLALVAGLIVFAVRAADKRPGASTPADRPAPPAPGAWPSATAEGAPSDSSSPPTTSAAFATGADGATTTTAASADPTTEAGAPTPPLDITAEPVAPPAPTVGASPQDLADWQQRQAEWKADHARWKARLAEDMRAVKAQRSAEIRSQAAAANAAANARRAAYRAANPRVGAPLGWLTVGLAIIAGAAVSALWIPLTGLSGYASTAALAAATLVFGLAALIAGIARRRSGFLITFGIILAALTALTAALPGGARASFSATSIVAGADQTLSPSSDAAYVQGWGHTTIDLTDAVTASGTPEIDLAKGSDATTLIIPADATVRLEAATPSAVIVTDPSGAEHVHRCQPRPLGGCSTNIVVGSGGDPDAVVRIAQLDDVLVQREQK